jgi:hypothetical protein
MQGNQQFAAANPATECAEAFNDLERLKFAQWVLERHLGWVASSEVKAAVIIAIDTAMLGALATGYSALQASERTTWANLLTWFSGGCLVIGVFCIAMAIIPRLSGPQSSNIFFGCICKNGAPDFHSSFQKSSANDLLTDCLAQIHRNAEIARDKFQWVRAGMTWSFVAILPWVAALATLIKK